MRISLSFAFILLIGCAGAPPRAPAEPTTYESTEADAPTEADRRFAEETRGYKLVERNGKEYYCRSERASGSNLKTQVCWTEAELRQRMEGAEMYRRKKNPSMCAPNDPRCAGG